MTALASHLQFQPRFARSANLERDAFASSALDGYVPTSRTLDVIERVARQIQLAPSGGAWSITGPYGSGKSSLALMLAATFGSANRDVHGIARQLLLDSSPEIAGLVDSARQTRGVAETGLTVGMITASREPISHTIVRALHNAVIDRYGRIPAKTKFSAAPLLKAALKELTLDDARRTGPSHSTIIEIATELSATAPLLLVIDEFGKNLEAVGDSASAADPYLLQQLVEASQGEGGAPIFTITMQHLSFEDYFTGHATTARREWAKVQGRFEDIPYVESAAQTRALIETVYTITDSAFADQVERWAKHSSATMRRLDLSDLASPERLAASYPLDPITLGVLPELCARYGQNERTLFSFLTGADPSSVANFAARTAFELDRELATVGLAQVYDYFLGNGSNVVRAGSTTANRWAEIATRVRDVTGITDEALGTLKAIAVLNLVSAGGPLRASGAVLDWLVDQATIAELEDSGVITYRAHADEYRIWQGSDVDINELIDRAEGGLHQRSTAALLTEFAPLEPAVAARHSAEFDTLRVFERIWSDATGDLIARQPLDVHDGLVAYLVSKVERTPTSDTADSHKPIVLAMPDDTGPLDQAARTVAAIATVLREPAVQDDWVARRELGERLAVAQTQLDLIVDATYGGIDCQWVLLTGPATDGIRLDGTGTSPLSDAADIAFPETVDIHNEMLNRSELTSQGAKARRKLLEAMILHPTVEGLDFEGFGPEVAMYKGLLERTRIHRELDEDTWGFTNPIPGDDATVAWSAIEANLDRSKSGRVNLEDIYASLASPPIGMKAGPIPVLALAALLASSQNVAVYEHGTFRPALTPQIAERLVKNPRHFEVKHFAANRGGRHALVSALTETLDIANSTSKFRAGGVLGVVAHLLTTISNVPNYTKRTTTLQPSTVALRDAVVAAVEPDVLLFEQLPKAIGLEPVPVGFDSYPHVEQYCTTVTAAVKEIAMAYDRMLDERIAHLLNLAAERTRLAVAGQANALADEVLDPTIRAFALSLGADVFEHDRDWIQNIATVVAKKAPAEWVDIDRDRFDRELPEYIAAFHRLVALHADQRATENIGFSALRVTVTRSDGAESARLISVDDDQRTIATDAVHNLILDLREVLGSESVARHAIYAVLSEQLLAEALPPSRGGEPDSGTNAVEQGGHG